MPLVSPPHACIHMCVYVYVDVLLSPLYTLLFSYTVELSCALRANTWNLCAALCFDTVYSGTTNTQSIFSLAPFHATWKWETDGQRSIRGPCMMFRREELFTSLWQKMFEGAVVKMIKEPFVALHWKVLVPLPVNILSAGLTARVSVALPVWGKCTEKVK